MTTTEHPLQWRWDQLLDNLGQHVTTDQLMLDRLAHALNTVHFILGGELECALAEARKAHTLDVEIKQRAWGENL